VIKLVLLLRAWFRAGAPVSGRRTGRSILLRVCVYFVKGQGLGKRISTIAFRVDALAVNLRFVVVLENQMLGLDVCCALSEACG